MGDQVKGRSPKKLKSSTEVPNIMLVKIHVLSFNMILFSSQKRVLTLSYPFLVTFGRQGKGRFAEQPREFHRGSAGLPGQSIWF